MNKLIVQCKRLLSRALGTRMVYGYVNREGVFLPHTRISNTTHIFAEDRLSIGDHVFVGHFSVLDATYGLVIEEGCQIGFFTGVFTHSSHDAIRLYGRQYMQVADKVAYHTASVHIGAYTFIGAHATILPGTVLGKGCVVSAYSLVKGHFPDFSIIFGNPAQVVGSVQEKDQRLLTRHPALRATYMGGNDAQTHA